jgi:hypothetical protein
MCISRGPFFLKTNYLLCISYWSYTIDGSDSIYWAHESTTQRVIYALAMIPLITILQEVTAPMHWYDLKDLS